MAYFDLSLNRVRRDLADCAEWLGSFNPPERVAPYTKWAKAWMLFGFLSPASFLVLGLAIRILENEIVRGPAREIFSSLTTTFVTLIYLNPIVWITAVVVFDMRSPWPVWKRLLVIGGTLAFGFVSVVFSGGAIADVTSRLSA